MKIAFRQSGGLLGNTRTCDTDSLSFTVATRARNLLIQSGIRSSAKLLSPAARDANVYVVTVSEESGSYEITVDDASMPEKLVPLIDLLTQHSKQVKR